MGLSLVLPISHSTDTGSTCEAAGKPESQSTAFQGRDHLRGPPLQGWQQAHVLSIVDPCANVSLAPAPTPRPGLAFPNAMGSPDRAAGPPHSQAHAQATLGTSCLRASPVAPEHPGAGAMSSLGNLLPANSAHALQLRPRAQGIHPKPREIPQSDVDDLVLSCLNVGLPCAETELWRVKIIHSGPWSIGHRANVPPRPLTVPPAPSTHPPTPLTEGFPHISE